MAITDCNMITVGCAVLSGHHCRYFEEKIDYHENSHSLMMNGYIFSYKYRLVDECHYRISIMASSVKL